MFGRKSKYKYTPVKLSDAQVAAVGFLPETLGFDAIEQNPQWVWKTRKRPRDFFAWETIVPRSAPPVGKELPLLVQKMIASTWQFAEPADMKARGSSLVIGTRGQTKAELQQRRTYREQVRPTERKMPVDSLNETAIASDWKVFEQLARTNAVTFRGDTRPPVDVIVNCGGFHPPNSRTDRAYLENNVFEAFAFYLNARYGRTLTLAQFLKVVNKEAGTPREQRSLVDYAMWRKITEREAMHLGRMTENECMKGYISTSRSIDVACDFATQHLKPRRTPGWVYVTLVLDGFVVPLKAEHVLWGTVEAEVAQWGPVTSERILGFRHVDPTDGLDGPIYIRREFRMHDPRAFDETFEVLSGKGP
jgi:hypothetical protein